MKIILPILIVGVLITSGFGAIAINVEKTNNEQIQQITEKIKIDISTLKIEDKDSKYVQLKLGAEESYLLNPGEPMMPRILKKYELPFGVTNVEVDAEPSDFQEIILSKEIVPTPVPLPLTPDQDSANSDKDQILYNSDELYPYSWCDFHTGCGLNADTNHVTHLVLNIYPIRYNPHSGKIIVAKNINIKITYEEPKTTIFPLENTYDLVIITPKKFQTYVQELVDHKNFFGVKTVLKTTQEIYEEYDGLDEPEQIKYFIKNATESWGIKYVLLFGGLKSTIYAKSKDDTNHGASGWYFPVRYSNFQYDADPNYNFTSDEPGYLCDLYYADLYKEGGVFDNWDSNGNGIFAEWSGDEVIDELDLYPDVAYGRLACTSTKEAKDVVNKIINYEKEPADPSWFNRIIVIAGDGFLDQKDLNIQWDTNNLTDGEYTIYAQSSNPDGDFGPIDQINITLDRTVESNITFNQDDHLTTGFIYPFAPVAEIVSISDGNILGNTDYTYTPSGGQAYCNDLYWWANISYVGGVLIIRGKSYDPKPYGNLTDLEVWIKNEEDTIIFTATRTGLETYYEGEWVVGEKVLKGRGGALTYMPEYIENNSVFTSNGKWFDQSDVIREFSNGYGLAYFSGHGSPGWWGDHYPGIPGNRRYGQVAGLLVTQFSPYFPFLDFPIFPMKKLKNTNKLPVVNVGGCHNSMFSVSLIPTLMNRFKNNYMFTYGVPIPECWGWYMVKLPDTGAIATMGNTGFGWGSEGDVCTIGPGDGWLNTEFYRVYGQENQSILGLTHSQAISNYISNFKTFQYQYWRNDTGWDGIDHKTVQQWQLLGDPSLKIGGYPLKN